MTDTRSDTPASKPNTNPSPSERKTEAERCLTLLRNYDFEKIIPHLSGLSAPITGRPLDIEKFEKNAINQEVLVTIEEALEVVPVVILIGPMRTGKSTVMRAWASKSRKRLLESAADVNISEHHLKELKKAKDGIALEEILTVEENLYGIQELVRLKRKLVLSPNIPITEELENRLHESNIPFVEVAIPLVSETAMQTYIGNMLHLPIEDELVAILARLSGGNLFAANLECFHLIETSSSWSGRPFYQNSFVHTFISHTQNNLQNWNEIWQAQKNQLPTRFHQYIPQPLLSELNLETLSSQTEDEPDYY